MLMTFVFSLIISLRSPARLPSNVAQRGLRNGSIGCTWELVRNAVSDPTPFLGNQNVILINKRPRGCMCIFKIN